MTKLEQLIDSIDKHKIPIAKVKQMLEEAKRELLLDALEKVFNNTTTETKK